MLTKEHPPPLSLSPHLSLASLSLLYFALRPSLPTQVYSESESCKRVTSSAECGTVSCRPICDFVRTLLTRLRQSRVGRCASLDSRGAYWIRAKIVTDTPIRSDLSRHEHTRVLWNSFWADLCSMVQFLLDRTVLCDTVLEKTYALWNSFWAHLWSLV
jgi:hypothetical protein